VRVLIDLDNTLVDRAGAFRRWAGEFAAENRMSVRVGANPNWHDDSDAAAWLIDIDRNGYAPRAEVAAAILDHFCLDTGTDAMVERLLFEHVPYVEVYEGVIERLEDLDVVVVTNGSVAQQEAKLRHAGLDRYLESAVISERIGAKKPDPAVFLAALEGTDPRAAWMVGDHPEADIAGARALGMHTAWVRHGQDWPFDWQPDVIGSTTAHALDAIARAGVN
jgi:5'-nucleotidase